MVLDKDVSPEIAMTYPEHLLWYGLHNHYAMDLTLTIASADHLLWHGLKPHSDMD